DSGGEPVGGRCPRANDRHVHNGVDACAGARIKDVMETSARLECGAVTTRHGKRHVVELDGAVDAVGVFAVANANAPGTPSGVAADGAVFAEIDDGAFEAFVAQHVGNRVRNVALGDAVQRNRHAGA